MATTDPIRRTIAYLKAKLSNDAVGVSTDIPDEANAKLPVVVVAATGGTEDDFLDRTQLLLDCHAATDARAYDLARLVASHMRSMPDEDPWVSDVETGSPYRNGWTRLGTPPGHCYGVTCDMTINK